MPDVTPKTESGRALLHEYEGSGDRQPKLADSILAIEAEAASAAVAEVLDRLERAIMDDVQETAGSPAFDDGANAAYHWVLALIASERKTGVDG